MIITIEILYFVAIFIPGISESSNFCFELFVKIVQLCLAHAPSQFVRDNLKGDRVEYSVRLDERSANRGLYGFTVGADFTRWRGTQQDVSMNRGTNQANFTSILPVVGIVYLGVQEINLPPGTLEYILEPGVRETVTLGTAGVDRTGLIIGNDSGTGWIGIISDFKVFDDIGTLLNHWPIDDDVIDGGTIVDISGGQDGILTLGSGSWVDAPGLPP